MNAKKEKRSMAKEAGNSKLHVLKRGRAETKAYFETTVLKNSRHAPDFSPRVLDIAQAGNLRSQDEY